MVVQLPFGSSCPHLNKGLVSCTGPLKITMSQLPTSCWLLNLHIIRRFRKLPHYHSQRVYKNQESISNNSNPLQQMALKLTHVDL